MELLEQLRNDIAEIFKRLGKIERTSAALYNTEVSPPNGLIPEMKRNLENHLLQQDKIIVNHLKNHKEKKVRTGDRIFTMIFRVVMVIVQIIVLYFVSKRW